MEFVDCHMHLDSERYEDTSKIVENAKSAGAVAIISSGVNPGTNRRVLELSKKYSLVKCSFGLYPIDSVAGNFKNLEEDFLRHVEIFDVDKELSWIEENKDSCVAIGEVGLDFKFLEKEESYELQRGVFEKAIKLAKKLDKVIVTHTRNGEAEAIEILESLDAKKVMMHCFSGKKSLIKKCVELGYYLSVPAVITRLEHFKMLVKITPIENLVTETDSPYLSPVVGEINEPSNIPLTIKEIAKIKEMTEEDVAKILRENARRLFGI